MPTAEICEQLLSFLPPDCPTDVELSGVTMGKLAAAAAADLLDKLPAVEAYWRAHLAVAVEDACATAVCHDVEKIWNEAVFQPLRNLRDALLQCDGLIKPGPDPFPENRADAMDALLALFMEAVRRTTPNRTKIGSSAGGPTSRFIQATLFRLGYGTITGDAVSQHFKRKRSKAIHP